MKKLLLLFTIFTYLFSCNSEDKTKTETANTDSTITDSTKKLLSVTTRDISTYLIDSTIATEMKKHTAMFPHTPKYIDSSLKVDIQNAHPTGIIYPIKAQYRKEDVSRYASTRGFQQGSDSAKVKNYKTVIYKVVIPNREKLVEDTYYYDIVTIKPPPPDDSKGKK
ncbi:MAG TPA: hypothetical protein VGP43_05280 [Chitinophagaceae bacterium]|nr:hypothetical protein [Chitinophagaceae bacterium]